MKKPPGTRPAILRSGRFLQRVFNGLVGAGKLDAQVDSGALQHDSEASRDEEYYACGNEEAAHLSEDTGLRRRHLAARELRDSRLIEGY